MKEIIDISLENEMDLVLAHRRSLQVGEQLGLTVATRTTFATAVSEVARTVIEYTDNGILNIKISGNFPRYSIHAIIVFNSDQLFKATDEGFFYAKKLLPDFNFNASGNSYTIDMGIGLPRSLKIDQQKLSFLKSFFNEVPPLNAYEEIKKKNNQLNILTGEQEEEIKIRRDLDEKKSEFISIASHELKTPITVVKGYTQLLKLLKGQYSEKVGQVLEKLDVQANKLSMLAQQLMDVSKMENGYLQYDFVTIDLNSFIKETVSILSGVYPDTQINILFGQNCKVNGDQLRLEQVFTNLLGNAVKYSQKGTFIDVLTELSESKKEIRVTVKDHGMGISKDELDKIFNKFYRLEEVSKSHPGLGMGLYITSKIVSDHGGKIWAESVIGEGSSFSFTIPVHCL
ncbi:signal transduction histidine kinase [Pedobacter cryoconitis]|uniref:ATP-binding protein n=1 Tax=Pedobacter cryoconitis TaxID=188932 RepID=UPI0016189D06|nr:sensor histidine kinase [Pedobacter cryoconitis]MBB6270558.1 signal transduction histidine kinase [Pedobacter cryoconitis]